MMPDDPEEYLYKSNSHTLVSFSVSISACGIVLSVNRAPARAFEMALGVLRTNEMNQALSHEPIAQMRKPLGEHAGVTAQHSPALHTFPAVVAGSGGISWFSGHSRPLLQQEE